MTSLPSTSISFFFIRSFLAHFSFPLSYFIFLFFHSFSFFPIHSHKFNSFILSDFLHFSFEFPSLKLFYYYLSFIRSFQFSIFPICYFLAFTIFGFLSFFISCTCVHLELSTSAVTKTCSFTRRNVLLCC